MTLDKLIRDGRTTEAQIADRVGVNRSTINRIRNGERQPSLPLAIKLASVTGLPVESFLKAV